MSKRIAYLAAGAFSVLALTAAITAPASAEEKTVMVGGAAMFPSRNIIQNAVPIEEAHDHQRVSLGSTVTILNHKGERDHYTIVGSAEADPKAGRVSNESPSRTLRPVQQHPVPCGNLNPFSSSS